MNEEKIINQLTEIMKPYKEEPTPLIKALLRIVHELIEEMEREGNE